ncbi:ribosome biogenesis GTPase Der [Texas Phoenix palm phytoplasma]|uniref:GTPase Der n=1 Tax=Texas Phoenix palm phytoplasma TaxID=176709 RepID=A0ABS5BKF4_9MOLU|nr:ribosome biogenesis GTPase Der [Texas Phoenix palm phytoplasma]MBP3059247.1 ribosome biogenesis GTPase Der [Texas Phoenix palm phytoplasma]
MNFKVAIVGRPNVGKSSLFNRMLNQRLAITDKNAGTTKDRIYAKVLWLNRFFFIIDTGGFTKVNSSLNKQIKYQTQIAIEESELILFVTDGQTRLVKEDFFISKILHKSKKNIILVVNKIDNIQLLENIYEFYSLGFSDVIGVSSQHGINIGKLLDKIISYKTNSKEEIINENNLKFCLVGKTNVGKSTFANALLSKNRMIVSDIPGTTTDSVDTIFKRNNKIYHVIDTAGLKKRSKTEFNLEKYMFLRTFNSIVRSDIVCFVLDISQPITEQDRNIASIIFNNFKSCIIIGNKWDLLPNNDKNINIIQEKIKTEFKFFHHVPIIFLSSKEKKRIHFFYDVLDKTFEKFQKEFSNNILNDILYESIQINPPSFFNNGKAKFYFIKQIATKPPEFMCLINDIKFIHFSYERFLKNQLRKHLELEGIYFKIIFKKKED